MTSSIQSTKEIRWADSGAVWRERIFWMSAGMLVLWFPATIISQIEQIIFCFIPAWQRFYFYGFFVGWPILLIGLLAAKGYLNRPLNLFWFFQSRPRVIALWFLLSVLGTSDSLIAYDNGHFYFAGWQAWRQGLFPGWLNSLEASALPLFLLIWLLPARHQKTARSVELFAGSTFDLSVALRNWRNELSAQPQLTADDRRELERHLADSVGELQRRGLSEEESFRQASQRIGSPQQLAEEFEKADPTKACRERIFWAAVGTLVFWQLNYVISCVMGCFEIAAARFIPGLQGFYEKTWFLFPDLVILLALVALIKGWSGMILRLRWFFQSRFRLALLLVFLAILCSWGQQTLIRITEIQMHRRVTYFHTWISSFLFFSYGYLELGAGPLILAIWFLPKRYRKEPPAGLRLKPR